MDNLEQVKKAVEIEVKHRYININGRTKSFSNFICSVLRNEIKQNPDQFLYEFRKAFKIYSECLTS